MLTADIIQYRKNYYQKHKQYLLAYSKWYYSDLKFREGKLKNEEVLSKPPKEMRERKYEKRKPPPPLALTRGVIVLTF